MRHLIFLLLISTACYSQPKEYNANQVAEDVNFLRDQLERFHPGLYRYTPKSQMNAYFEEAAQTSDGLEGIELYARITFLLSQVKCGHTRTAMPDIMRRDNRANSRFPPFQIQLLGAEPFISASLDSQLPKGAKLLSINGKSYQEIEATIFQHLAADGFIESGKRRMISWFFPFYYQLYIESSSDPVNIEYQTASGENVQLSVNRVRDKAIEVLSSYEDRKAALQLNHLDDHSYMRISTFGQQSLSNAGLDYELFLEQSFRSIKNEGVENLVLDLRGNGGGRDNYGALLVSYLLADSFGYFDNIEVTDEYSGYGGVVNRKGKKYVTSHQGLNIWEPQSNAFQGNLYVLTDGGSFSTCADVATVLHHNDRGVFIGQETGGGYDGNTSGNTKTITLPNSGIRVFVPLWKYTTANVGHPYPARGVIPDHEIIPTWDQFSNKEDVVLNKALDLIRNKK
ncbi:MAG: S41 family peptidase [Cytophagales bacterium]|nr:S41 family peptidase [Cytophagales bacterium]